MPKVDDLPELPIVLLLAVCAAVVLLAVTLIFVPPKKKKKEKPKLIQCEDCGRAVSRKAVMCPGCGRDLLPEALEEDGEYDDGEAWE